MDDRHVEPANNPDRDRSGYPQESPPDLCRQVEDLIPAFALGATDAVESKLVLTHLAECPQAAAMLQEYSQMAEFLHYTATYRQAPPHLEHAIMSHVAQVDTLRSVSWPESLWLRLRNAGMLFRSPARAAVSVIGLLLILLNLYWLSLAQDLRRGQHLLAEKLQDQHEALMLLGSEERQEFTLPAAEQNSQAQASVLWSPEFDIVVLYARSFPPLEPAMQYQLWLLHDGARTSAGLFSVDDEGDGSVLFHTDLPLDSVDVLGITPEPQGGSAEPTAPAVVRLKRH